MKLFVLSLHRCGTSSVHQMLEDLGYWAIHCPRDYRGADWEKKVKGFEMDRARVFQTIKPVIDAYEVISDVPIPVLYEELDAAYPEAKFILLSRSPSDWAASTARHCRERGLEPFEKVQYGRYLGNLWTLQDIPGWKLEKMMKRHKERVLDYFIYKPGKLFFGQLGDEYVGRRLAAWLGKTWEGPLPHLNRSA